ncbi:hypothetical protein [Paenibacillus senegalensis]|uniref:hypothetical protein n=1 Tax=Paenibacillus senegalensis TaxID=1465766 RepID=UPI00028858B0|nr:hypothetical protein [Paenibacillus senegalensis]
MRKQWKKTAAIVVLSVSLAATGGAVFAATPPAAASWSLTGSYALTEVLSVDVKSLVNERIDGGSRIGTVIRMTNQGDRNARVPDYELRVETGDGLVYTLQPSGTNARTVQPKETVELSYILQVDRQDSFTLSALHWIDIDWYVYPKAETKVLSLPVEGLEWTGSSSSSMNEGQAAVTKWGDSFSIPSLASPLVYTPVKLETDTTPEGYVTLVTLLVENPGERVETVPDFELEGLAGSAVYPAGRVEQQPVTLSPKDKKYIHYSIPSNSEVAFQTLNVLTNESYVQVGEQGQPVPVQYQVGRLHIALPDLNWSLYSLDEYTLGDPMVLDTLNAHISKDLELSMVELSMHENEGEGYKTAIAKFTMKNTGDRPIAVPPLEAELRSNGGYTYGGVRQATTAEQLMPNLNYVVSYFFAVPDTEDGSLMALSLSERQTTGAFKTSVASYRVAAGVEESTDTILQLYPYQVAIEDWHLRATTNLMQGFATFSYQLNLDLDITIQDKVVVDQHFSNLKIELLDQTNRLIATETRSFVGMNRLVDGLNKIDFTNLVTEQHQFPLTIKIYESMETPSGEAKRLLTTFTQR